MTTIANPATANHDVTVWSPIDLTPDARQPAYKGTTGSYAYPGLCRGDTGRWGLRLSPLVVAVDVD